VKFNQVFGYYIEVTKANASRVPQDYQRKQTLVNAERYTTKVLQELEGRLSTSDQKMKHLEFTLFVDLRIPSGLVASMAYRHSDAEAIEGDLCPTRPERSWLGSEDAASEGTREQEQMMAVRKERCRDEGPEKLGQAFPQNLSCLLDTT